eukprot:INCI11341.2.p1 GENE.INCI11341.2~~INCI11341.2.p1  ORF type:complete len:1228 (-),score=184.96 INCI11341.2:744-4427(-)
MAKSVPLESQTIDIAEVVSNSNSNSNASSSVDRGRLSVSSSTSPYQAFLEAENTDLLQDEAATFSCWHRFTKTNFCARGLRRYGLLFADDELEQEYELDFMRSVRNYRFLGWAGGLNLTYTCYLMSAPLINRIRSLEKYAAIFNDPDQNELFFSVHAVLHGVLQLALNTCLVLLAVLGARRHRLCLSRIIPVVAFLWLISLTALFMEVELTNLWDWQSGLANITLGNINESTFTPFVTVKSCSQNLTDGIHVRDDGCEYTFESMSRFALFYGWTSGTTNSELFIANIWSMATLLVVGKLFKASSMLVVLPIMATGLFLVSFNPIVGFTNLNVNNSLSTTLNCSYAAREVTVALIYEMCLAVIVAMTALVYLVTVQERDNRELFFWTKILHVKRQSLLKQVDPFSPEQLQQWFEESLARRHANKSIEDTSSDQCSANGLHPMGAGHASNKSGLSEVSSSSASLNNSLTGTSLAQFASPKASERHILSRGTNRSLGTSRRSGFGTSLGTASSAISRGSNYGGATLSSSLQSDGLSSFRRSPSARPQREYWDIPEASLELVEVVAAGGAGIVWRANLDGNVVAAKKILAMSDLMLIKDAIRELAGEVRILGRLNHINVLKFLGLCIKHPEQDSEQPASVFIVTEWCTQNLRTWIQHTEQLSKLNNVGMGGAGDGDTDQIVSDRDRYDIAFQIANGMKYLHSKHIMHRDLKPENVLITDDGRACICDFGLSVAAKKGRQRSNDSTQLRGTPGYIAPEIYLAASQASRQRASIRRRTNATEDGKNGSDSDSDSDADAAEAKVRVTAKIDIFAYGILLWEIFADTGISFEVSESRELDMQLESASESTIMNLIPLPDVKKLHSTCSGALKKCMKACWAFEAETRPSFEKISLTLRLAMQYYDCGDDFERIHAGVGENVHGNHRGKEGRGSVTARQELLSNDSDAADIEASFRQLDARSNSSRRVATTTGMVELEIEHAARNERHSSGRVVPKRRHTASLAGRKPSSSFAVYSATATASRHMRAYAAWLYISMRCWGPRKLHFASLSKEYRFLQDTLTTPTYFRSLKFALGFILVLYAARAAYLSNSMAYVSLHNNQTFDARDFFDLYIISFSSLFWIVIATVCVCASGCHKYWPLWVRYAIIVSELVIFVGMPLYAFPTLAVTPFDDTFGSSTASTSNASASVYAPLDSSFFMGYVTPTPEFKCGGTEWSPFFEQSANLILSIPELPVFLRHD